MKADGIKFPFGVKVICRRHGLFKWRWLRCSSKSPSTKLATPTQFTKPLTAPNAHLKYSEYSTSQTRDNFISPNCRTLPFHLPSQPLRYALHNICKIHGPFSCSIMKILHLTKIFTQAPPVVPVTNMRYGSGQDQSINSQSVLSIDNQFYRQPQPICSIGSQFVCSIERQSVLSKASLFYRLPACSIDSQSVLSITSLFYRQPICFIDNQPVLSTKNMFQ